tara:strand:+ start:177 stop:572 length:396 start_codon:yes stop_codon:yes gene_type:complete
MSDVKTFNCPACGFNAFRKYNKSKEISELLKNRSKNTRKTISKITRLILENVSTENTSTYFYFLYGLKEIEDNVLCWGIEQYYRSRHYTTGKGFAYLRSIIQNRDKNMGMLKKNERKRLGTAPPIYKQGET